MRNKPCDSPGDRFAQRRLLVQLSAKALHPLGSHRTLDPDRVEALTPPYLHKQVPFAPAANNFPVPALVELKWASTSEFKVKVEDSQHRDQYW